LNVLREKYVNYTMKATRAADSEYNGFTLTELLVVIAIIAILAALLLPVLSMAKEKVRNASCQNHLHQIGLSMQMYTSDYNIYPPSEGGTPYQTWADRRAPFNPFQWTNVAWQCPTYIAEGGAVLETPRKMSSGYAYNARGMWGPTNQGSSWVIKGPMQGLSTLNLEISENRIVAPSEMYAVGDTRPFQESGVSGFVGRIEMRPWKVPPFGLTMGKFAEAKPPHAGGYNLLFVDGHVSLVKQRDYLYPPRSAQNWNRDHQPHPELWCPTSEWVNNN
jgi:prepilin-type N-terminal cleavage/methylation domain-containing protein/prepilin-type processing-associated H-X9-DG protein